MSNWVKAQSNILNPNYKEGWKKGNIVVWFTKDNQINIYEEENENLSLDDLMWIYNKAKSLKG